ncbi:3-hydroxy-3-methylglutaryl-CoA reductase [Pyrodictium occultum]|uniref:3-hydroxy-3-methylglutaryl coenzyme A reductase n=2 Tax=Pyrodictium occultum TaxID=2309 RepID=A0A0V8RU49_PYROC|nr:hydroxymethylglutaryl-CoA reductase (NADPH) [Pyrodictium occultum]KSW11584.1 3-hydroxy-3-methylglutaryl-CoA reductase [Pyrodictium occultum]
MGEERSLRDRLEEVVQGIVEGRIRLHEADRLLGNANAAALARRLALERMLGVGLSSIGSTILDFEELVGRNIENPIGAVQIPLGVAGPLRVHGEYARGDFYIPLATTEGALVASVNRGAKAVTLSGGARARVLRDGMARAPVFWTPGVEEAARLAEWVQEHMEEVRREAESTTRHGRLLEIQPFIAGNIVWLRFVYSTGDAMGMNMATIATDKAAEWILRNYPGEAKLIAISGNLCTDKKPALLNAILGRGKTVVAEATIKRDIALRVLKAAPEDIDTVNRVKNLLGSARAGSPSFNAHYANIIAAIFIATGQDVAQVVESSMGYTWTEVRNGDLYISVTLPSLELGTVGGGTRLPTQREALALLGAAGGGNPPGANAKKLAEVTAAAVLAGELNLLAALAANELARAHRLLGRGEAKTGNKNPTNHG